ncbi:hypothetical protein BUALT_Bualt02G0157500 [Buddleja alternifolia]|uniref:Uncharacterized protein n=1 Tax=Buddleja alternifolia TaxID=168488 RepID=A0AAV6YB94_9LAMI|nr:hypothetical protein BUALT_Bualt02G0157500 [Buddleja alternifolia]
MVRRPVPNNIFDSNGMKKGAWSEEEDNKLRDYIRRYGHANWRLLPKNAGLARCGKSCRLRWVNYLKPGVKRGSFSSHEKDLIVELHAQLGTKWSAIASKFPGRTDNDIKNFWHAHIDRRSNPKQAKVDEGHDTNEPAETTLNVESALFNTKSDSDSTAKPQADDTFQANYTQIDYCPQLSVEGYFFNSEFSDSSKYSSFATSYVGDRSFVSSSDCLVESDFWSEPFGSYTSNPQSENSYISPENVQGLYDHCLIHYFDDQHVINCYSNQQIKQYRGI